MMALTIMVGCVAALVIALLVEQAIAIHRSRSETDEVLGALRRMQTEQQATAADILTLHSDVEAAIARLPKTRSRKAADDVTPTLSGSGVA